MPQISPDDRVMAKELVDYFFQQRVDISYAYARALIVACPASIRSRYIRAGDAWSWWVLHPQFQPFAAHAPRPGASRDLAEFSR